MNLTSFSVLVAALPVSVGLVSACGGTADVGNDRTNVNAAGTGGSGTGGDPNVVHNEPSGTAGLGPGGSSAAKGGAPGGVTHDSGMAGAGPGGSIGSGGATGTGASSGAAGAGGSTCGGLLGATCGADEWCDYTDPACGAADGTGVCTRRPQACDQIYKPVCGCDGKMYGNACAANMAGVDATSDTSCFPKDGGAGSSCVIDSDCALADDYCHGGCDCVALGRGELGPTCANPVSCFAEPCAVACGGQCAAHCDSGVCVAR